MAPLPADIVARVSEMHGKYVQKVFRGKGNFVGVLKIVSQVDAGRAEVLYEDGDTEDFDFKELAKKLFQSKSQGMSVIEPIFVVRPPPPPRGCSAHTARMSCTFKCTCVRMVRLSSSFT